MSNDEQRQPAWRGVQLTTRLRHDEHVSDAEFDDAIYPPRIRRVSKMFWTPVAVAVRAARLLAPNRGARLLDVGSGVGKFCIVAAASTSATVVGVEHRLHLVHEAKAAAARAGVVATFRHGHFEMMNITDFDAVYLFNPFLENCFAPADRLDLTITMSKQNFGEEVRRVRSFLDGARHGTRVVTYHGLGGKMPPGYKRLLVEDAHTGKLELWLKSTW